MKIISIRNGFECDHSSSNYEFFSSERALTKEERKAISGYSRRSHPGTKKATFSYFGDYNLPHGAEKDLLTNYFDVMVSESYDWWQFAIAFDYDKKLFDALKKYECEGSNDTGISIEKSGKRIIVHIYCQIEYDEFSPGRFPIGIEEEEDDESDVEVDFESYRNLLINLKREILKGDFSSLHAVCKFFEPSKLDEVVEYTKVGKKLQSILVEN